MSLDLAKIVQGALRAVPSGLRATVRFERTVGGELDTATDTRPTVTTQFFEASVVITTPAAASGQPVDADTRVLILAASDATFRPRAGHLVKGIPLAPATDWRVVSCKSTDPSGVAALYEVEVKR